MAYRILIVDDEPDIREFVGYNLSREGYDVYTAENGAEGLAVAERVRPHLILLDLMMPVMDGHQTCEAIRRHPELKETMVVFLSAVDEEQEQLESFLAGADDYINKPVRMRVLCSRVGAIMKRLGAEEESANDEPSAGSLTLNENRRSVITEAGEETLSGKEFEILRLLYSSPGRIFSREEIYAAAWSDDTVVGERTLDVHIRRLRRKIGDRRIVTLKGVGYSYSDEPGGCE